MDKPANNSVLGQHLIADFSEARHLTDPTPVHAVLERAASASGARVLEVKLHDFGDRAGYTGVALLAESHISVHTWPEFQHVALDIFMCGSADPMPCFDVLKDYFEPRAHTLQVVERKRVLPG